MKISFIFPSRSRSVKFFAALNNIRDMCDSQDYEIICALDEDDPTMNNQEVKDELAKYNNVTYYYGLSANKIAACNREVTRISQDTSIICLHSDDMKFLEKGFDNEIREAFKIHFPNLDGVVHFPDQNAKARTMTYTMMGVNLYNKLGYLYWPGYISIYADNDLTDMTKMMGKYVFVNKKILNHFHPIWNLSSWDAQYRKTESKELYKIDRETFMKRTANNFGL